MIPSLGFIRWVHLNPSDPVRVSFTVWVTGTRVHPGVGERWYHALVDAMSRCQDVFLADDRTTAEVSALRA